VTWTNRGGIPAGIWNAVAYGNGIFVAVRNGTAMVSADGAGWENAPHSFGVNFYGIAYGSGQFVAVGAGNSIISSPDGREWGQRKWSGIPNDALNTARGIAHGGGMFIAVKINGLIRAYSSGEAIG
jgi:hypothetical protein